MKSGALTKIQYMSSYWSAITHDYEHGGLNNDFLMKTAHPLAILYNDQSPLENHHCAAAAGLLFEAPYQFIPVGHPTICHAAITRALPNEGHVPCVYLNIPVYVYPYLYVPVSTPIHTCVLPNCVLQTVVVIAGAIAVSECVRHLSELRSPMSCRDSNAFVVGAHRDCASCM